MDFFTYANIAGAFTNSSVWYVPLLVGALCYAVVYIFQGVGLFVIGGREGYSNRWLAFVPFANVYYIGVCAQKNRFFRRVDTKTVGLITAVLEALLVVGNIIYSVAVYKLYMGGYLSWTLENGVVYSLELYKNVPYSLGWAAWCFTYLNDYILFFIDFIYLFLDVLLLSAFFQTFAARRYLLFTITSILFPIQGILIFILRNNRGMSYRDYIRGEQERQYKMYQQYQQQNYNQNPYNQNPYSRGGTSEDPYSDGGNKNNSDDPFSGLGSNDSDGDDPFDGFDKH